MIGAIFLMATSAIGPGFLTQTSVFTVQMGAAFAFAILLSIIVDIAVQLNVWRILGVSGMRASELANEILPGLGWVLAVLVGIGGLVFNIGNIAGTGLGIQALTAGAVDPKIGGALSAIIAIVVFLWKRAGAALDVIVGILGAMMILLMLYVAISSNPPVADALRQTVAPERVDFNVITTLIGGSIGGYIVFAGVHRLIDAGHTGPENVDYLTRSSVTGIIVTGVMRVLLFLAVLGVVATGVALSKDNTAADVFYQAAGDFGRRAFGLVLWAAGLSSVIGASFTSISFLTKQGFDPKKRGWLTVVFIVISSVVFLVAGSAPQKLLIFAGAFNGLILPIAFAVVLWAGFFRKDLLKGWEPPKWTLIIGLVVLVGCVLMGWASISKLPSIWA
ncbi:NRAMP family divalent metal transporter [Corynebacterium fournieri]|uniref:NRAMP family divalent metal transporter n=1 Tax=Corynebacterium fournieri TaxID=1852390 RepID=UPI000A2F28A3|nr:NRAMP family divalent metal transporter [Corynebacterium fournieri]WJY97132.1 Natural resistance-associated macrophage protein [Corynebacterium fournieri]